MMSDNNLISLRIPTADGSFVARYSKNGLAALSFPAKSQRAAKCDNADAAPRVAAWHQLTVAAVKRVLAGRDPGRQPPLDLSAGTKFQRAVWRVMRKLPRGRMKSYGEVAAVIGRPRAVRAVGSACGANPIPLLVPCHRILAAGGKLGGFGGGVDWKRRLLDREGVLVVS